MSERQDKTDLTMQVADTRDEEINILDLLDILARRKKVIFGMVFLAAIAAAGISKLMPNKYTAMTSILIPQQSQSAASALLNQLGGMAGGILGGKGISTNELYVSMLNSRNVVEGVAKRFGLQEVYHTQSLADAAGVLAGASKIKVGKDGVINVQVDDKDPQRAADLANAYVEELRRLVQAFALTEAAQRRQFFEGQMKQARDKLSDAEIVLDRTPQTSLRYMDAVRNLKYQESIYEVLLKQFEMAKIDEAKDAALIQVLDVAVAPERKSGPKRTRIVLAAMAGGLVLAVMWVLMAEGMQRMKRRRVQGEFGAR